MVDCVWNVTAHAQKPDFIFRRNGRVHLNGWGRQFSWLLAGELCTLVCRVCTARASLCSAVMWRLLVTHAILLLPLHFSTRAPPCTITFQLDYTTSWTKVFLRVVTPVSLTTLSWLVTGRAWLLNIGPRFAGF